MVVTTPNFNADYLFEKIQKKVEERSELYSEAEYYKAVSALNAGYSAGVTFIDLQLQYLQSQSS